MFGYIFVKIFKSLRILYSFQAILVMFRVKKMYLVEFWQIIIEKMKLVDFFWKKGLKISPWDKFGP